MIKKTNKQLYSKKNFLNREISQIEFNHRVLLEAQDKSHPLLERLKFISILSSNLDEFFMIRVAGLKSQIEAGLEELSYDGKNAAQQLEEIREKLIPIYHLQDQILNDQILPELENENIRIIQLEDLTAENKKEIKSYFTNQLLPILTPLVLDSAHPFPRLIERSLNIAFVLTDPNKNIKEKKLAFIQIPSSINRLYQLKGNDYSYVLIENIIKSNASQVFPGMKIEVANTFRVTRDADIEIAEDEAEDLLQEIKEQVKERKWNRPATRLEVSTRMPKSLLNLLKKYLELEENDIYYLDRPLKLVDFMQLLKIDRPDLKDAPFVTKTPSSFKSNDIFGAIAKNNIMVHHPFDSFSKTTLKFLNQASEDKDVIAIKITLYRTSGDSQVIKSLMKAAENGKEVTAFVELKARFDEENNILWARELENAGVHVVYGVLGLKTHCKICLVIRKEKGLLKKYTHLSTGNYHEGTARLYTDLALFTSNKKISDDAVHLFNYLTGYSNYKAWNSLSIAPTYLAEKLIGMINREAELQTPENPGLIRAKLNQIAQRDVITALYKASQKGVKIEIVCRGVCCLKPGVEGLSENIEVRSIIGRFLEHTRIYYFKNAGNEEIFIASADWMTRNLHKRVEILTPILTEYNKDFVKKILDIYWKDNCKSWNLNSDGTYTKINSEESAFSAQSYFLSN